MVIIDVSESPNIIAATFYVALDYEIVDTDHYFILRITNLETKTARLSYMTVASATRYARQSNLSALVYKVDDGAFDTLVYTPNTFYKYEIFETINNTQGLNPDNVVGLKETGKIWFKGEDEVQYTKVPEADQTNSVYLKV